MQPVSREVHVHPIAGLVLQVRHRCGLDDVGSEDATEATPRIAVREVFQVLLIDFELSHALLPEHARVLRHPGHHVVVTARLGLVVDGILLEEGKECCFVHGEDLFDGLPALVEDVDVLFHGVPRDVQHVRDGLGPLTCGVTSQDLLDS